MNSSSSNSNYGFRNSYDNSNETNTILGFDSPFVAASGNPGGAAGGGSGSNLSRPRLMKMRRQTSQNPRSTASGVFDNRRGEEVDPGLGFNPFRASSESVFGKLNSPNRAFQFGGGSSSNLSSNSGSQTGIPSVVFDDFRKMQIDSDKKQTDAIGGNAAFNFKAFESENKKSFSESVADQLPNEINKLNIGDRDSGKSSVNLGNMNKLNPFRNNMEADLEHEMYKMNLGNPHKTFVFGRNSKSDEHLVGKPESANHGKQYNEEKTEADLISDKMKAMKVSGYADDKSKIFVFGLNNKQHNQDEVKDDLISDKMQELKVGGDEKSSGFSAVFDNKKSVFDNQNVEPKVYESTSSTQFQPFGNASFTSKPEKNVEFIFSSKSDNFAGPNVEMKTPDGTKSIPEYRLKKKKGKIRKPVTGQPRVNQDFIFGQKTSLEIPDSFEAYSPMDVSPYNETLADNYSKTSVTSSDDVTSDINSVTSESHVINSNITTDEDLLFATQRLNVNDGGLKSEVSEAETFKSAMENMEFSSDSFATALDSDLSSTATSGSQEKTGSWLFKFGSKLENINNSNFTFAASTSSQGQLSPDTRQHKKKHRLKTSQDSYASSSILSPVRTQKGDTSTLLNKNHEQDSKIGTFSTASVGIAAEEACEKWRLRGNQAYGNGDLAKAEDYYTQGLNSVCEMEKSKDFLRALMLCYSNRAATRISLGKMKDALKDCLMAAAIDPNFLKVQVRAAYCYLAIGEVEKATVGYMKCLQSGNEVCVDRKLLVEASQGLEKAQKVRECLKQYTELPRETYDDYERGLKVIDEALQISSYSEQLLQMKADTLLMLRKYDQIIHMCQETMNFAETETPTSSSSSSWRSNLIVKSYFYLGKLEEAHQFIKKQESSTQLTERLESMSLDSKIPLADTIQELLSHKAAGNEAYKGGKYTEAVEHYSCAISCSIESRPFAAVCFCNRAAAYRGLGQITDAIADCSLAIALHPTYLKAISRRAGLYEMIRDYEQAATDLQQLLTSSQMEEKGGVDKSSELRQIRVQLYNVEEQSRKEIPLNMYLILGVEPTAAASEIKKAYRKAALKHHPDKAAVLVSRHDNGDDGVWKEIADNVHKDADRLFKMIGEAYAVLSNPSKRSQYDMDEEMRNEIKNYTRSGSGRDVQSPNFERSGSRRWQDSWNPQSKGQENATSSSHRYYSRYS